MFYGIVLAVGCLLWGASEYFPAHLPFWMPWEFSPVEYGATALALGWFVIGWRRLPAAARPSHWRTACFVAGVLADYAVLQTHFDFYAQHMFFIHRWAHFVLHHAGAFLIALGTAGRVIRAGMPAVLDRMLEWPAVRGAYGFLQHPAIAPVLFVGLLYFWLLPSIHTRVMLDIGLYRFMNWTMAVNGVMFWALVLDPRPKPPAKVGSLIRAALILAIELPQMVLGALLSLSATDYYPVYEICGRALDMTALNDQHYGGLIIWLPGTMMSFAAMLVVLNVVRLNDEARERRAEASALLR